MIRAVRAELRKLCGPMLLWVTIVAILLSVGFAMLTQEYGSSQLQVAEEQLQFWTTHPPSPDEMGMTAGSEYEQAVAAARDETASWAEKVRADVAFARATQSPLGAGGLAAACTTSAIGVFALLVLACFHVAGEWGRNSVKEVFVQSNRRAQFVVAKLVSLWIAGLWLLMASWAALALWGLMSQHVFPIAVGPSPEAAGWSLALIVKAPVVLLVVASLGVLTGIVVRNAIGALSLSALAVVFGDFAARSVPSVARFSPAAWIAEWMGFKPRDYFRFYLWVDHVREANVATTGVVLTCLALATVVVAAVIMKRRNVLS